MVQEVINGTRQVVEGSESGPGLVAEGDKTNADPVAEGSEIGPVLVAEVDSSGDDLESSVVMYGFSRTECTACLWITLLE